MRIERSSQCIVDINITYASNRNLVIISATESGIMLYFDQFINVCNKNRYKLSKTKIIPSQINGKYIIRKGKLFCGCNIYTFNKISKYLTTTATNHSDIKLPIKITL